MGHPFQRSFLANSYGIQDLETGLRFFIRYGEACVAGCEQKCVAIGYEGYLPQIAVRVSVASGGALLAAMVALHAAVLWRSFQETIKVFAGVERLATAVALEGRYDDRCRTGGRFEFKVFVGLAEGPESRYGKRDVSARDGVCSGREFGSGLAGF